MKTILLPGKFAPFHEGHKYLLDSILQEGNQAILVVKRPMDEDELIDFLFLINDIYEKDAWRVRVVVLPFDDEIRHGRTTGYKFKRYPTPKRLESISATNIRKELAES